MNKKALPSGRAFRFYWIMVSYTLKNECLTR